MIVPTPLRSRLGIGSYAFRYAIGTKRFRPSHRMSPLSFLKSAHDLNYSGVLLCENLGFDQLPDADLRVLRSASEELGLFVETGMRHLSRDRLVRHLDRMRLLGSRFLRIVVGPVSSCPDPHPEQTLTEAASILREQMPACAREQITVGLENHFDLDTKHLIDLVDAVDSPQLGIIFDTTNALGFIERPEETLAAIDNRLLSIHLKDYCSEKEDTGYHIHGTILGEGVLDVSAILKKAWDINPSASVILELSLPVSTNSTGQELLDYEQSALLRSTQYLRSIADKM